ncbi:uncharacterized protein F5Z01DRAFT_112443 [Emericellopsis atlantica]|uniref:Uncharacterized protein n=1 Tax=Emericellopsis atlantica TaxID=2614577 RepID=A0A9P7ZLB0_9HYPO|nr:uncharacterized protein F5Z01DRAFT_112443 [Emericellopsis atlantica]KAG9254036.1 hypothetical protein F5Z01DRAFT_112443 [Emericellopsis atlantica]
MAPKEPPSAAASPASDLRAEITTLIDGLLSMPLTLTRELELQVVAVMRLLKRLMKADLPPSAEARAHSFIRNVRAYKEILVERCTLSRGSDPKMDRNAMLVQTSMIAMGAEMSLMAFELDHKPRRLGTPMVKSSAERKTVEFPECVSATGGEQVSRSGFRGRRAPLSKEQKERAFQVRRAAWHTIQPPEAPRDASCQAVPASGPVHTSMVAAEVESGQRPLQRRVKVCYMLLLAGGLFILGSMVWGIHCSLHGAMGDGFTGASWLVAVGTLVLGPPMAIHYRKCRCWVRGYDEPPQQERQQQQQRERPGYAAPQFLERDLMPFQPTICSMSGRHSQMAQPIGPIDYSVLFSDSDNDELEQTPGAEWKRQRVEQWAMDVASGWDLTYIQKSLRD